MIIEVNLSFEIPEIGKSTKIAKIDDGDVILYHVATGDLDASLGSRVVCFSKRHQEKQ